MSFGVTSNWYCLSVGRFVKIDTNHCLFSNTRMWKINNHFFLQIFSMLQQYTIFRKNWRTRRKNLLWYCLCGITNRSTFFKEITRCNFARINGGTQVAELVNDGMQVAWLYNKKKELVNPIKNSFDRIFPPKLMCFICTYLHWIISDFFVT